MKKLVRYLVIVPLAIMFIILAVANRQIVTLSLDPFSVSDPSVYVRMPLFILILAGILVGVLAGGMAAWLRQGKWRRTAREKADEASRWRAEASRLRENVQARRHALPSPDLPDAPG